jgi:Tol biopolymer transport system component
VVGAAEPRTRREHDRYEYGPLVSADGRTLYFTSHRGGNASLYRIPTATVGIPGNE